jgi:GR25 family glycosyltransferase involved in LPS biosynthesis
MKAAMKKAVKAMAPMKAAMKKAIMKKAVMKKVTAKKSKAKSVPKVMKVMKKAKNVAKAMKVKAVSQDPSDDVKELKAVVVNLKTREDRWARVSAHLSTELPWLSFERFFATYGKEEPIPDDEVAPKWNTKCNALYGEYEDTFGPDGKLLYSAKDFQDPGVEYLFSGGERGCAHSHYRIWKVVAESEKPMLVLEDDVKLNFDRTDDNGVSNGKILTERLNLGMAEAKKQGGFDVLYLGWSGLRDGNYRYLKSKPGRKNPIVRRVEYVWTTVAYVLWPEGARKLLKAASPMNQPVDNFMAWEAREGRLNRLCFLTQAIRIMIGQEASLTNSISLVTVMSSRVTEAIKVMIPQHSWLRKQLVMSLRKQMLMSLLSLLVSLLMRS